MAEEQPEQFGRYALQSRLGQGGMAETWRAQLLGAAGVTKPVLIKKVLPEFANDTAFIEMFISEARISATLSHGNIAQVFDFGRMDGQYFLAMELVDGQPLHRVLKRAAKTGLKQMPIPLAVYIALEMCRGLHYAHSRTDEKGVPLDIVHRDISPDNVLISYEGQVKIVDFGIAKARMLRSFDTEPGIVKGKFLYFSPEQARGRTVDARTDVWATGLVLYEMLCGQHPVTGTEAAVMSRMAHGEFPSPREVRKDLPSALNEIVMRALSVEASLRYESSNAFGDELASFLHRIAPRFSTPNLAYLLRELYREDLRHQGRELVVPPTFIEELTAWRGSEASAPLLPPKPPSFGLADVPTEPLSGRGVHDANARPSAPTLEELSSGPIPWGVIIGGGLALLTALAIPLLTGTDESGTAPPGPRTLGPDTGGVSEWPGAGGRAKGTADEASPDTSGTAGSYPDATVFRLDSRRQVLRVPTSLVAFPRLDEAATYQFWMANPSDGLGSSSILEPSPRRDPRIFFLLAGEAVPSEQREGIVPRRPLPLTGIRAISLFTLGEPVEEDLASQAVFLRDSKASEELRFTFHPEPMRVSADSGLLIRGLDVRQTYVVSLTPVGDGVFLRGRAQAPATQVACLEWPSGPSVAEGATSRVQPVQFFLSESREVKVRGIQGLSCGFVDDDASDNEGEADVRITPWDPKSSKGQGSASARKAAEAKRLAIQAQRLARAGRVDDAYLVAKDCISNDKEREQPDCLLIAGDMQARLGRMEDSAEFYRAFVQQHPKHPQVARVIGLLRKQGQTLTGPLLRPPPPTSEKRK
ncbi:serine/threonine-protein kinase [Myxococcus qinghaiensis]|uniref:serine/threonine-protein kinase n=1 Tax=Myxococcus qinghaiensis TaxID=2906758 RepID=UPI002B219E80|nr:serine/threonine-protein kinase [Myxococcus qinghaiensis]